MKDRLETLVNWLSDMDREWWPFLFMRPEKEQRMNTARVFTLAGLYGIFAAFLQHANIRTPRWLGYIIQRPEAHGIHHQRGVHGYNYADLPLWDMVFGTFRNPAIWREQAGFYEGGSKRIGAMLIGRDISTPESNPMSSRPEAYREPARAAA